MLCLKRSGSYEWNIHYEIRWDNLFTVDSTWYLGMVDTCAKSNRSKLKVACLAQVHVTCWFPHDTHNQPQIWFPYTPLYKTSHGIRENILTLLTCCGLDPSGKWWQPGAVEFWEQTKRASNDIVSHALFSDGSCSLHDPPRTTVLNGDGHILVGSIFHHANIMKKVCGQVDGVMYPSL